MPAQTLSPEDVAASAYRACAYAAGVEEEPVWDHEGLEMQARWQRLVLHAQAELPSFDGQPAYRAARWLFALWSQTDESSGAYDRLLPRFRLCWEAVARHLATLLDSDEVEDLAALERSWSEWALMRLEKT